MKMEKKNKKHVNICCWCKKEVQKLLEKHLWNRLDLMVESQCWLKIVKAEGCPLEVFITCSRAPCEKSVSEVCLREKQKQHIYKYSSLRQCISLSTSSWKQITSIVVAQFLKNQGCIYSMEEVTPL